METTSKRAEALKMKQAIECSDKITRGLSRARGWVERVKRPLNEKKRKDRKEAIDWLGYAIEEIGSVEADIAALKCVEQDSSLIETAQKQIDQIKTELLELRPTLEDLSDDFNFSIFNRWSKKTTNSFSVESEDESYAREKKAFLPKRGKRSIGYEHDENEDENENEKEEDEEDAGPSEYDLAVKYVRNLRYNRKDEERLINQLNKLANIISLDLTPTGDEKDYMAAKIKLEEGLTLLTRLNPDNDIVPIFTQKIEIWEKERKRSRRNYYTAVVISGLLLLGYAIYKMLQGE